MRNHTGTRYQADGAALPGFRKLSLLAALAWTGIAGAQQTINKTNITSVSDLIAHFATADANPANTYNLYLAWVKDANGNTVPFVPPSTITLTKGKVNLYGSNTHLYADRYIFDGQGQRRLFSINGSAGGQPTLTLSGITVRNGYTDGGGGGGFYVNKAYDVQVYYCRFLNNRSYSPGAAIFIQATRNFYMMKSLVDGNQNQWYTSCGGGDMGIGGGISYWSAGTPGSFSLHNSTISNNKGCRGGGLQFRGDITLNMHNNTISGNVAQQSGGGIHLEANTAPSYFYHNTITNNSAGTPVQSPDGKNLGGGLLFNNFNGSGYWSGNVVAKNLVGPQVGVNTEDCHLQAGWPTFQKYTNVVGRISNCSQLGTGGNWGVGTNNSAFDPLLGALSAGTSNDGFSLPVHLPLSNSPLRGNYFNPGPTGPGYNCPGTDERGWSRKQNGCDIGAVERGADGNP
jgi:parallel beta-helix repeat protein